MTRVIWFLIGSAFLVYSASQSWAQEPEAGAAEQLTFGTIAWHSRNNNLNDLPRQGMSRLMLKS
ncbi:MAG: hypothetical protein IIA72_24200 [Proteobacteria bacterium]|nr:hypothetical protein [Pseudomonadota bacterium]